MLNMDDRQKSGFGFFAYFTFFCFSMASVFDPSGLVFHFRGLAASLIFVFLALQIFFYSTNLIFNAKYLVYIFVFSVFLPVYGLMVAAVNGGLNGSFIDTSYIASAIYLILCIAFYFGNNVIYGCRVFLFVLRILACLIVFVFAVRALNIIPGFVNVFVLKGVAFIGEREYGGISFPYIYFITSPLLVFLLANDVWAFMRERSLSVFILLILSMAALFLSGTRAAMSASIITPILVLLWGKAGKLSIPLTFGIFCLFVLVFVLSDNPMVSQMISPESGGNQKKIGYINDYLNVLSDPATLYFGQGFNAHVWSSSLGSIISEGASKSELTYLELARVFGLPIALLVIFMLFYLPFSGIHVDRSLLWVKPSFFMYLVMAFVNPYLFSLNGMFVFGIVLAILFKAEAGGNEYIKNTLGKSRGLKFIRSSAIN